MESLPMATPPMFRHTHAVVTVCDRCLEETQARAKAAGLTTYRYPPIELRYSEALDRAWCPTCSRAWVATAEGGCSLVAPGVSGSAAPVERAE